MSSVDELKRIHIFEQLPTELLEKLSAISQVTIFSERAVIFKNGQPAEYFYALLKGKVLLEVELAEDILVSLDAIDPGEVFGWSAFFPRESYGAEAICAEPCEAVRFSREGLNQLMEEDPSLGYHLLKAVTSLLKTKVAKRTEHLLKILRMHPDLAEILPK